MINYYVGMKTLKKRIINPNFTFLFLAYLFLIIGIGGALYVLSYFNYLLFHTTAELFSIIIAAAIFILAWNTKDYAGNNFLLFLGITYLFVGILDFFHALTYKGINLLNTPIFYATEFWVAARYLESISLLIFVAFFNRIKKKYYLLIMITYAVITTFLILSISVLKIFPTCFIDNVGLTPFKIVSEYVIISVLSLSILVLLLKRTFINRTLFYYFIFALITTILSEFVFTLYTDVYGFWNLIGHYFKIISFYLIYKAIIQYSLKHPFELIFNELKQHEEQLQAANVTKDKFFSIIAHDLKGPFSGILGFSKLLYEKYDEINENNKKYFIGLIHNSAEQAFNLLENLLNWARMQTDRLKINKEMMDFKAIVEDTITLFANYAKKKEIQVESKIKKSMFINADKSMIATVVSNLVNNALKYTKAGGKVTISASLINNHIEVKVIDTGVGIEKENIEKLFKIDTGYTTLGTDKENGTGLGLILCKEFIDMHNGEIRVESDYGKGTTFSFSIPT
jgi:signal transduction histidine kinase